MAESKPQLTKPSVGIDLGTTYSCVAVFQNGRPEVIANSQGNRITPSVVTFTKEGRLIGEGADIQRKLDPPNAIYNAKRFIGRTWDDPAVQASHSAYPFKVVERNQKIQFQIEKSSKTVNMTPEEIAAAILSKMKAIAEDYLEEPVEDVVVTVPAYFNDSQRQATVNAGKIAGLNVTRIINEPTAAAMAYGLREGTEDDEGKHVLVYDLGGGTFDVSVLEIEDDLIQVKATAGNTNLGGEDFNDVLVKHFKQEIFRKYKFDLSSNCKSIRRLTGACEKTKRNLSAENVKESKIQLDHFLPDGRDFLSTLSRAKFENLCKGRFEETIKCVDQALRDAKLSKEDIDEIILVGGSSRIPKLQSMLSGYFNNKILNKSINPDEAVACGAAVQAAIMNNDPHLNVKDMLLMDVIPLSIGVDGVGGLSTIVVEKNSAIPVRRTITRVTVINNQTSVRFRITEGERTMTKDNRILGSFDIYGLPPRKAGEVKFDMEFEIDENGILTVSSTVKGMNKKAGITLDPKSSGKLSNEEIKRCIKEADMMKVVDQNEENRMMAKNKLSSFCNHVSFLSHELPENDVRDILKSVAKCLAWINEHPEAEESQFISKHDAINNEAKQVLNISDSTDIKRSSHVLRMGKQNAKVCLKQGKELQMSDNIDEKVKASEYFIKAYKIATESGHIFKEIEALFRYGQIKRILSSVVSDCKLKLRHALETVKSLSFVLDIEENKTLSEDERTAALRDIQLASQEFFATIGELDDEKKFYSLNALMRSLDSNNSVKNPAFSQIVFQCRIKELNVYVTEIAKCLSKENVREALKYSQSLNYAKEQAKLLAKSQEEKIQLTEIIKTIQVNMSHAEGLHQIEAAINVLDGVDVDHPDTIDKAIMALDHLSEAKHLSKGAHNKVYTKANFFEGKIFMDYIPNASKAKSCFEKVVAVSKEKN